jgi:hypothetical protein
VVSYLALVSYEASGLRFDPIEFDPIECKQFLGATPAKARVLPHLCRGGTLHSIWGSSWVESPDTPVIIEKKK